MISARTQSGRPARPTKNGAVITVPRGLLSTVRADSRSSATAASRNRRTDLGGLVASIGVGAAEVTGPAEGSHQLDRSELGVVAAAAEKRDDSPGYAVLLKAACGVAIGLAMSSRALFPGLLLGAKNRIRQRLRGSRANGRRR